MSSVEVIDNLNKELDPLRDGFEQAGRRLYLVGGVVRDILLGALDQNVADVDLTTDATPEEIESIVSPVADNLWLVGKRFGTISLEIGMRKIEITTHRAESYESSSRKPSVNFSKSIDEDLSRRDFTINAMAIELTGIDSKLIDPFGGLRNLLERKLKTPGRAEDSFSDDPLRMLRAARFVARFGLEPDKDILDAAGELKGRLSVVSPERIREELSKLLVLPDPTSGLWFLIDTGVMGEFLPEIPALALEQDPVHRHKDVLAHTVAVVSKTSPDLILRMAALLHDIGKPKTREITPNGVSFHFHDVVGARMARKRLLALKYSSNEIDAICKLVELHLRFHTYKAGWNDKAVRRYVRDAGPLYERLNELTLADVTTRDKNKVKFFHQKMEELQERVKILSEQEELASIRPELDGNEVMEILGIGPSKDVGDAMDFLLEIRLDEGIIGKDAAKERLQRWWRTRPITTKVS
ncbi:poly(A) polymerase [Ferrithrix thermotolerans DSM 19514]|uniref:Poly(A) polymerase n=1 Tax=Ferrithrix thermotolerans DSM 19514 TaxID=1121881 RepID=A0A1M4WZE5_9ACTN|nr:CCA tRNA nucleotidyltransferase [Ferrithrix thermotolerans]SHE86584.1 poly(A) polymerase [Ferrithrix thermotolerans DSM 19514]